MFLYRQMVSLSVFIKHSHDVWLRCVQRNWDEKIDTVLMWYCSSQQTSTKHSPQFMLFQKHYYEAANRFRSPDTLSTYVHVHNKEEDGVDLDSDIQSLIASRERVFPKAKGNITSAQKQQKDT